RGVTWPFNRNSVLPPQSRTQDARAQTGSSAQQPGGRGIKMFTKHVIKQLSAYCNGELSAEESRSLREHLLTCERCRREHDEVKLGVQLAQQLPLAQAPADMWEEIEMLLDAQAPKPLFQPRAPKLAWGFGWSGIAAVSAVVVVAVAFGL